MTLGEFLSGREESRPIFDALRAVIATPGLAELYVTKSQVAFRRGRAFAWV